MTDAKIGKVTHYYDKIGVAVLGLSEELKVGDKIRFVRGGEDLFEQEVASLQVEHEQVDQASPGNEVGIKTLEKVKDGTEVYKVVG